jgi:hypothetical protein
MIVDNGYNTNFNYRGSYNNSATYSLNDLVINNDSVEATTGSGSADNILYYYSSSIPSQGIAPNRTEYPTGWTLVNITIPTFNYRGSYNNSTVYSLNDYVINDDPVQTLAGLSDVDKIYYKKTVDGKAYIFIGPSTLSGFAPNASASGGWWLQTYNYRGSYNNSTLYSRDDFVINDNATQAAGGTGTADNQQYVFTGPGRLTIQGIAPNSVPVPQTVWLNASPPGIPIGPYSGKTNQLSGSVALGSFSGQSNQGPNSVAIGTLAGNTGQAMNSIAIGTFAGNISQQTNSVAIGTFAGNTSQRPNAVAIGTLAGNSHQRANTVAIGSNSGETVQNDNSVAIGYAAGQLYQRTNSVAIGTLAGNSNQGMNSIAIGNKAGSGGQNQNTIILNATGVTFNTSVENAFFVKPIREDVSQTVPLCYNSSTGEIVSGTYLQPNIRGLNPIAIGTLSGSENQGVSTVAIGYAAGNIRQKDTSIAIGQFAGQINQNFRSVAIGTIAARFAQDVDAVAIGNSAGLTGQSANSIAIGNSAGAQTQNTNAVAIGPSAGSTNQGNNCIAIGLESGQGTQQPFAVAIGQFAGRDVQGNGAVAIGVQAGQANQGSSSVAIGKLAGHVTQPANSIVLNATGTILNGATGNAFFVKPIRTDNTQSAGLYYNSTTGEVVVGGAGGYSVLKFYATESFTFPSTGSFIAQILVVAGSGGVPGNGSGIHSGSGGVIFYNDIFIPGGSLMSMTVGGGGTASINGTSTSGGSSSFILNGVSSQIASGGGGASIGPNTSGTPGSITVVTKNSFNKDFSGSSQAFPGLSGRITTNGRDITVTTPFFELGGPYGNGVTSSNYQTGGGNSGIIVVLYKLI